MDKDIKDFIDKIFEIKIDTQYHFKTLYGFTFVFTEETASLRGSITSSLLSPTGIIYEENGEYYFAPLDETYQIEDIIAEYVKKVI